MLHSFDRFFASLLLNLTISGWFPFSYPPTNRFHQYAGGSAQLPGNLAVFHQHELSLGQEASVDTRPSVRLRLLMHYIDYKDPQQPWPCLWGPL